MRLAEQARLSDVVQRLRPGDRVLIAQRGAIAAQPRCGPVDVAERVDLSAQGRDGAVRATTNRIFSSNTCASRVCSAASATYLLSKFSPLQTRHPLDRGLSQSGPSPSSLEEWFPTGHTEEVLVGQDSARNRMRPPLKRKMPAARKAHCESARRG